MRARGTATFVKDVSRFFTGSAALYRLVPPIRRLNLDSDGNEVIDLIEYVVAADVVIVGGMVIGATLYQCDDTGYVTSWNQVQAETIMDSKEQALASVGYQERGSDA